MARLRFATAESALVVARGKITADSTAAAQQLAADTLPGFSGAVADSLEWRLRTLDRLRLRTVQAPLPTSYRALAEAPELRSDPRIRALLDSLSDVERERQGFGAVGGVDPVFVALTSRANDLGRAIVAIGDERRNAIQAQLQPQAPPVATATPVDTAAHSALRDSARLAFDVANAELGRRRAATLAVDREEKRARERAAAVAPPLAMLASAFVLSAVIGFAFALFGELRKPRVSDANELERYLGVRVLSTIESAMPSIGRGRRQADRTAPRYFDPGAEGYQLAYLAIATDHPEMLAVTVTGDHPGITAVIACNMAAVAADEARNTLVVDLEPTCSASAALRAPARPGVVDILHQRGSWPDVTIPASVGRDKTISLVPHGVDGRGDPQAIVELVRDGSERFARYYDAVFLLAATIDVAAGLPAAAPAPEVVYCAQPGITPLRELREALREHPRRGRSGPRSRPLACGTTAFAHAARAHRKAPSRTSARAESRCRDLTPRAVRCRAREAGVAFYTMPTKNKAITGYSDRINHALAFAAKHHDQQVRKGTRLPYLTHPANVAIILTRYGCDEPTVVAGILHDVVEDCVAKDYTRDMLEQRIGDKFGADVLDTVLAVTHRQHDDEGDELSSEERKDDYLARLGPPTIARKWVCAADKLHNANSISADLQRTIDPDTVWSRFAVGGRYRALVSARLRAAARAGLRGADHDGAREDASRRLEREADGSR